MNFFKKAQALIFLFLFSHTLSASTKILVFGDFGTGDENQKLVARDMTKYCQSQGCDFAVTVGDNIYPKGVVNLFQGQTNYDKGTPNYQIITDIFVKNYNAMKMPFYMSFGNHDVGNEGLVSIFKDLLKNQETINKRTVALMTNEVNYTNHPDNPVVINSSGKPSRLWSFNAPFYHIEEKDGVNLFAINTNTYPHRALKDDNQLDLARPKNFGQEAWLKDSLQKAKPGWKIVFGHMPLYSHGRHGWQNFLDIDEFRNSIIKLLCQEKVDFYLSGHDHHLEVDKHICPDGHVITAVLSGAAAKTDRVYQRSFPFFSDDKNLLWANGKFYKNSKLIYKNDDEVLGFAHITLDGPKALLKMELSKGASADRKNACFGIIKSKAINPVACN